MELTQLKLDRMILMRTDNKIDRGEVIALSRSISRNGLLVPFTVRRILNTDRYEIISGVKRFYACKMAHFTYAPAYVISISSDLARIIVKRGERKDIFEEGEEIKTLLYNNELKADELCELTGYTENEIYKLLKLTRLSEFEKEMIRRNSVSSDIVYEIAELEDISRRTEILSSAIKSNLKASDVKRLCEKKPFKSNRSPKFKDIRLFDNTINRAVTMLKEVGVKASVDSSRVNGGVEYKVRIEN